MSDSVKTVFSHTGKFLSSRSNRLILLAAILAVTALAEFIYLGLARRTFVFYTVNDGILVVEDRMLKHSQTREVDITRYVEETLLGPVSPGLLPLFPRGTKLKSLLFRDGVVYADFTDDAALPPIEGGKTLYNFQTFYSGILRNFPYIKDVRFFIEGNAIFINEFHEGTVLGRGVFKGS